MKSGTPTFDQLHVFLTIVETGSFAAAARRLHRVSSVISYTITNLEQQLGVTLFDRETTRKPQLTEAGLAVLAEARTVAHSIDALRAKVNGMLDGLEADVSLAVSALIPGPRLVDALTAFEATFPTVTLRLSAEALDAVQRRVLSGEATIGVGVGLWNQTGDPIERIAIGEVEMVVVAAPSHPLASRTRIAQGVAREHTQLVMTHRSPSLDTEEFGVIGNRTWRLSDLSSKHMLLLAGIGWGTMPAHMVQENIEAGRLVKLRIPEAEHRLLPLTAIYRTDQPPGPAGRWLIRRFVEQSEGTRAIGTMPS